MTGAQHAQARATVRGRLAEKRAELAEVETQLAFMPKRGRTTRETRELRAVLVSTVAKLEILATRGTDAELRQHSTPRPPVLAAALRGDFGALAALDAVHAVRTTTPETWAQWAPSESALRFAGLASQQVAA